VQLVLQLAIVVLLALGSLSVLVATRPPLTGPFWSRGDDLALVVAWAGALAASAWLFVATGTCLVALGLARPTLARRVALALPFGIRSLVEVAIVGSLAVLPALPAPALGPPRVSAVALDDQPVVRAPLETVPIPRSAPAPTATRPAEPPGPPARPNPLTRPNPPPRVVVVPGDNLWLIARASLARALGGRPNDTDVARYWHAVIAQNRSTLRSGDPSLIFPGEIVTLPPVSRVS
jgi:hypothetical protein